MSVAMNDWETFERVIQNGKLYSGERLSLLAIARYVLSLAARDVDPDGYVLLPLTAVSREAKMSKATLSRHIDKACAWGLLEKRVTASQQHGGWVTELRIRPVDGIRNLLGDVAELTPDRQGRRWGGYRR